MTTLTVFDLAKGGQPISQTVDDREIMKALVPFDVRFERWQASRQLPPGAGQPEVLEAYAADIDRLKKIGGYQSVDVVRIHPEHPDREAMRTKFLSEHIHTDDEVRFFVEGAGAFYLRNDHHVLKVVCTAGDLLSVPNLRNPILPGVTTAPSVLRGLVASYDGWVAEFTGDKIADSIPKYAA